MSMGTSVGGASMGMSSMGSGMGSGMTGMGGMGGATMGGGAMGMGGSAGTVSNSFGFNPMSGMSSASITGFGSGAMTSGQSGFIGGRDNAGRFIGNAQGATSGTGMSGMGMSGMSQFGGGSRGGSTSNRGGGPGGFGGQNGRGGFGGNNQFNQFGNNGRGGGNNIANTQPIQPQLKANFTFSTPAQTVVTGKIDTRFSKLSDRVSVKGVQLSSSEGVVTIRGTVASDDDRRVAEQLVRLEPGVKSVKNEITVTPKPEEKPADK